MESPLMNSFWLWPARILILAALSISIYLLSLSGWDGSSVSGCGNDMGFGCDAVLNSPWSSWLGAPVSLPGAALYALTLLALFAVGPRWSIRTQTHVWMIVLVLATAMVAGALWFLGLQALTLGSFCPYCLGVHACALLASGLIFWHCPIRWTSPALESGGGPGIPWGIATILMVAGLIGPGILIAGQLSTADVGVQVVKMSPQGPTLAKPTTLPVAEHVVARPAEGATPGPAPARGGDTPQPKIVLELFDYTCSHCRQLHRQMKEARERYGDQLHVELYPMPMCHHCNRFVKRTERGHEQACAYARLALAVKRLDRAAFLELHDWLMESAEVPSLAAAQFHAAGLVRADALDRVLASPQVEEELQKTIRFYAAVGQGKLPKLVIGEKVISGVPQAEQHLFQLLEAHAGVKAPMP